MNMRISRKYCRNLVCIFTLALLTQSSTHAVEYLITDNQSTKTQITSLSFVGGTGLQTTNLLYIYAKYTASVGATYTGIQSANLQLSSSAPATAYVSPSSNFTVNDTFNAGTGTYGQLDANGYGFDSVTSNYTGGTGSTTQATADFSVGGGFDWAFTTTPPGTYYILLGSTTVTVDTSQTSTFSLVSVTTNGTPWAVASGAPGGISPAAATFGVTVSVPEPSTYATAALACAALGGVALKKRRKAKLVESA